MRGVDALSTHAPGPSRGTSSVSWAATVPLAAPLTTFALGANAAELALEAVAVAKFVARVGDVVVTEAVVDGDVVVEAPSVVVDEWVRGGRTRVASTRVDGVVVRAEAVIEKSITSNRSGLDHITNWVPQRGEVVRVIGV